MVGVNRYVGVWEKGRKAGRRRNGEVVLGALKALLHERVEMGNKPDEILAGRREEVQRREATVDGLVESREGQEERSSKQ